MKPRWSPSRVAGAVILAAWAGLFWSILATDRTRLYLSPRTEWVVPLGAIVLTIALVGRLLSVRAHEPEPLRSRDALGAALLILPVVLTLALPPAALGSFAASRRSSLSAGAVGASAEDISKGELSLVHVAGGLRSREGMQALVERAGEKATFVGFVARTDGMPADEFLLTRFLISCCVADALGVQVRVVGAPPGEFAEDEWLEVSGKVYPLGREVLMEFSGATRVERPKHPYLSP